MGLPQTIQSMQRAERTAKHYRQLLIGELNHKSRQIFNRRAQNWQRQAEALRKIYEKGAKKWKR